MVPTGDMWGQQWSGLFNDVKPYPDKQAIDITEALQRNVCMIYDVK